jgi:hypothetical protein
MTASGMGSVRRIPATGILLAAGAGACFLLTLVCAESVRYRLFWPELFAATSLALVLASVWTQTAQTAGRRAKRG